MEPALAAQALGASTEIATAALSGEDPEAVLRLVVRHAAELADADLGLVMARARGRFPHRRGRARRRRACRRSPTRSGWCCRHAFRRPRGWRAAASRSSSTTCATDPRTAPFVPRELRTYGPFAAAPFGTTQRRLGALTVYRQRGAQPFAEPAVEVLTAFAAQAGLVLVLAEGATARARLTLYQERERIARDLHDVLVQRLYAAGMQLDLLARRPSRKLARKDATAARRRDRPARRVDRGRPRGGPRPAQPRPGRHTPPTSPSPSRLEVAIAGELLGFPPELDHRRRPRRRSRRRSPTTPGPRCGRHCPMWSGTPARHHVTVHIGRTGRARADRRRRRLRHPRGRHPPRPQTPGGARRAGRRPLRRALLAEGHDRHLDRAAYGGRASPTPVPPARTSVDRVEPARLSCATDKGEHHERACERINVAGRPRAAVPSLRGTVMTPDLSCD